MSYAKITATADTKERFETLCRRMGWKHFQGIEVLVLIGEQASDKQLLNAFRQSTGLASREQADAA